MIKKILKYISVVVIVTLIVLMITNPSIKQFKEYIGIPETDDCILYFKRTHNYLIYSEYEFSYYAPMAEGIRQEKLRDAKDKYIGFFLNFHKKPYEFDYPPITEEKRDSPNYKDR